MEKIDKPQLRFFASGYCKSHYRMVHPGSGRGKVDFYATWCLVDIPGTGYVMFDTGYSERFSKATQKFPGRFYRWITPRALDSDQSAKELLRRNGISSDEIRFIIISHFHADHIAGLADFPSAKFISASDSIAQLDNLSGFGAVKKGILHNLIPGDFKQRIIAVEDFADRISVSEEGFITYHLFGCSFFRIISLPGHSTGMLGFIYDADDRKILFATDAAWDYDTYSRDILPSGMARIIFSSWDDYILTRKRIKAFEKNHKSFDILFTHCPVTLKYVSNQIKRLNNET